MQNYLPQCNLRHAREALRATRRRACDARGARTCRALVCAECAAFILFEQCLASRGVVHLGGEVPTAKRRDSSDFVAAHPGVGLLFWRLVCGGIERDDAWAKDWLWRLHSYTMESADEVEFDPFEERAEVPQGSLFVEVVADSLFGECEARRERSKWLGRKEFLQALWHLLLEFDKIHDYDGQTDRVSNGNCDDVCEETFEGCLYD
ncbi:hypothetical protein T492DRAFT_497454 [Pavlovales sp. CCMP2436]|nr:hypothetical protein T492DRAFT_497454 [Pavlovales sp. CCMP2436]